MKRYPLTWISLVGLSLLPVACMRPLTPVTPIGPLLPATQTATISPTPSATPTGTPAISTTPTCTPTQTVTASQTPASTCVSGSGYAWGDYRSSETSTVVLNGTLFQQYAVISPSTLRVLSTYVASVPAGSPSISEGIYNDDGNGHPSSLIFSASQTAVVGWNGITPSQSIAMPIGAYWLAVGSLDGVSIWSSMVNTANAAYAPGQLLPASFSSISPAPSVSQAGQGVVSATMFCD
jgi:hypothetical protein